ncbi:hypothetical protein EYC80_007815 [Monilinia laxa]|uniref:Uncharacterized protein n=1 Tax=Monilinia laxa TaxID=61186 RepID=A0A5N6JX22_MONLA|nr:hypothetical protein EYC80_007815 [Monilinia laxa]
MNRHHYVGPSHRALKYIDRTSEKKIALRKSIAIYQQKIEDSWALPQSDCHHFLKFPQGRCPLTQSIQNVKLTLFVEIIEQILGYLVKVPAAAVAPGVVTCNWKKFWVVVSSFVICKESREDCHSEKAQDFISPYDPSVIPKSTKGEDGRLTVLRRVHEAALDACVLRVCRSFSNIGGNLLYGRNRYTFRMNNGSLHGSPPTWIGKERWRPPAGKPYLKGREHSATGFYNRINRGITDIQKHVAIKNLAGWVFHDPFLRFLYTIATENTTLIQTLEFSGEVHCHRCETGHFCDDCIFDSLRVYIPFINALCPKVRKLTLSVRGDFEDDENVVFDQRSVQFFQEARQLKYITELVVRDLEPRDSGMMPTTASILAEPTIKYFNDRVVAWNK